MIPNKIQRLTVRTDCIEKNAQIKLKIAKFLAEEHKMRNKINYLKII